MFRQLPPLLAKGLVIAFCGICWTAAHGQVAAPAAPETTSGSTAPDAGMNVRFLDPGMEVDEWIDRFESESREIFHSRAAVLRALGIKPGMAVADVGAGTGFFSRMFAEQVGDTGWVYAVEISPRFAQHNAAEAERVGVGNMTSVLCSERSTGLPPCAVDLAFMCDTYHHLSYPQETLASLHRALRPGGMLIVIDFERIPGTSREWILGHVRAGKETFREEIEAAGFRLAEEVTIDGFSENYFLKFCKQ